jgi:GGDEF domain-containing protein
VRAPDVVARVGGDEFVALLWNASRRAAATKAAVLEAANLDSNSALGRARRWVIGASAGAAPRRRIWRARGDTHPR